MKILKVVLTLALTFGQVSAFGQNSRNQASSQEVDGSLTIGGRSFAPLLDSGSLPSPKKPEPKPPQSFSEIDTTDFLSTPELLLFDSAENFSVNMETLRNEVATPQ